MLEKALNTIVEDWWRSRAPTYRGSSKLNIFEYFWQEKAGDVLPIIRSFIDLETTEKPPADTISELIFKWQDSLDDDKKSVMYNLFNAFWAERGEGCMEVIRGIIEKKCNG